jgi:hypothetical protein
MHEVQATRSSCGISLTAILFLVILFSVDGAQAQQKIKLAHASVDTTNAVWYVPKEKGFYLKSGFIDQLYKN